MGCAFEQGSTALALPPACERANCIVFAVYACACSACGAGGQNVINVDSALALMPASAQLQLLSWISVPVPAVRLVLVART
jgi:hypothetical protein